MEKTRTIFSIRKKKERVESRHAFISTSIGTHILTAQFFKDAIYYYYELVFYIVAFH